MSKILFLTPYPPGQAPSQRFRFEQYLGALTAAGHTYELRSFLSPATWAILYKPVDILKKGKIIKSTLNNLIKEYLLFLLF